MRKVFTLSLLLSVLAISRTFAAVGPLIGTYSIPNLDYPTLQSIIAAANTYGFDPSAGTVTINLNKDETAPVGGFVLGSTKLNGDLVTPRQLIINGKGHTLMDTTGVGNLDAIFTIQGTDFVTINNIVLKENPANTTNTTMAERGFSVVKLNNNDGVHYLTLKDCNVILNKTNTSAATGIAPAGSTGIFVGNCLASSAANLSAPSVPEGSHESIFMSEDTIQNVRQGVYGQGLNVAVDGIVFNDKQITVEKSVIQNFVLYGVYLIYFNNDYVQSNYINNISGGGAAPTSNPVYGVVYNGASSATNNSWNCEKNTIDLTCGGSGNAAIGIYTQIQGTGTTVIGTDSIKLTASGTSAQLFGIYGQNNLGTLTMSNNIIHDFSTPTTNTQMVAGIYNGYASSNIYPTSNSITGNLFYNFNVCSGSGNPVGACLDNNLTTTSSNFTGNTVSNITVNAASAALYGYGGIYVWSAALVNTATISNNTFTGFTTTGNATPMMVVRPVSGYTGLTEVLDNNKINNLSGGTGDVTAVRLDYGTSATVSRDTITKITGGANVFGILAGNNGYAIATLKFNDNQMTALSTTNTTGALNVAMAIAPGTTYLTNTATMYNNTIAGLSNAGAAGRTYGIYALSGTATYNMYNNMLSDMAATSNTTDYSSTFGIYLGTSGVNNVYYNTVNTNIASGSGTGYGATGLFFTPAGTNNVKNNIFRVDVVAGTANNVAAVRASSGSAKSAVSLAGFSASNNIYYTPTGANNYLYVDGTTNASLVNGYAVSGLTANATKNIVNDTFFNTKCDRSFYHNFMGAAVPSREKGTYTENNLTATGLWFTPTSYSYAESGGTAVTMTGGDITSVVRSSTTPDMGALEFSGKVLPTLAITVTSSTGFDTACPTNLPTLTAAIPAYFTHVSYQWYKDTTALVGDTSKKLMIDPAGGHYVMRVYDSVTGCTTHSDSFLVTIVPPPPALITYYDSLVFCETSAIVLSANYGSGYSYQWYKDGSMIPGSTSISQVVSKAGNYQVEVNTPLGCPSMSGPIGVRVYPLPTPTITQIGMHQLKTELYYTYQWYKNNIIIPDDPTHTSKGQSYYAIDDGAYTVEVTDSNGCTNKSTVYLYTLGIHDPSLNDAIKVFPNPTSGLLNINSPVTVRIMLTDVTGRVVFPASEAKSVDLSPYAPGLYIMTIMDKDGTEIRKERITRSSSQQ